MPVQQQEVLMRKRLIFAVMAAAAIISAAPVSAQDEDAPKPLFYAIYYDCDVTQQGLADEIIELAYKSSYDAAVEAGTISSWGWMAHHTGPKWRRLFYHSAPDMASLLTGLESVNGEIDESYPEMGNALGAICNSHVDYVWRHVTGSRKGSLAEDRGTAAMSVYFECEMSGEERADEIVEEVLGPIYDRYVASGELVSWGWMEHIIGGDYRRIATMTGKDYTTLLATRAAIGGELRENHPEVMNEFRTICDSHQDALWEVVFETP